MKKIAILGCENSHANMFLDVIKNEKIEDIEIVGCYSHVEGVAEELAAKYGIYAAKSYDEFVGKVDGVIITARHGERHYLYAKPYLDAKIPLFIDKPLTISEEEAVEFMNVLKKNNIPAVGGSICVHADLILDLKKKMASGEMGDVLGGYFRAPLMTASEHGGFFFYAQHMIQVICSLYGYYPESVLAFRKKDQITVVLRYENCDVTGVFFDNRGNYRYYAAVNFEHGVVGAEYGLEHADSREFHTYYDILTGKEQEMTYDDLFAPVFIMNAIVRSLESGKEERVRRAEEF